MLVKLPDSAIHRIAPADDAQGGPLYAMGVGGGVFTEDGQGTVLLVETEEDTWTLMPAEGLDLRMTRLVGECVTSPTINHLLGFVLPGEIEGRKVSRHVVMRDPEGPVQPYEDLEAVRAKYGEVVVGHDWGPEDERGYHECRRCKDRKHRSFDKRRR
jgi:hypothetical protein